VTSRKDEDEIWAIVPVKHLARAKSRLAPVLGTGCAAFMRMLAQRTVVTLAGSGLVAKVLVVTSDPAVTSDACDAGALTLFDWASDLNDACLAGIDHARANGAAACMIVMADLALLDGESLSGVVEAFRRKREGVGLVRCKSGTGTTIAIFDARTAFVPGFGQGSFARHRAIPSVETFEIEGGKAAFDVDTPADLDALAGDLFDLRLRRTADAQGWAFWEMNDDRNGATDHAA
jgi:2-phospho-L-lactate guanylyltransferase